MSDVLREYSGTVKKIDAVSNRANRRMQAETFKAKLQLAALCQAID